MSTNSLDGRSGCLLTRTAMGGQADGNSTGANASNGTDMIVPDHTEFFSAVRFVVYPFVQPFIFPAIYLPSHLFIQACI